MYVYSTLRTSLHRTEASQEELQGRSPTYGSDALVNMINFIIDFAMDFCYGLCSGLALRAKGALTPKWTRRRHVMIQLLRTCYTVSLHTQLFSVIPYP